MGFWRLYSRLRSQTLVTKKSSLNLTTEHSLTVHVWHFSFGVGDGRGKQGWREGKGNRTELGDLGLNVHRACTLVAGDQLQLSVILGCNSWSVGLFKHSTKVIIIGR